MLPAARQIRRWPRPRWQPGFPSLLIALALLYFLLPLYWIVLSTAKDNGQLFGGNGLLPAFPWHFTENLRDAFAYQGGILWRWLGNSLLYACLVGAGSTFLSALAGYAFAKFEFPLKGLWYLMILGGVLIPFTALVLPIFLLMHQLRLLDTLWAFVLPSLVNPFGVYLMTIFWTQSFPEELREAATLDGAGEWTVFTRIGLPLVRNGLVTVALFAFVDTWNNFFLPLVVFSKTELFPATVGLSVWNSTAALGEKISYTTIITATTVSFLPLLVLFLVLQRSWKDGLALGAIK